jgi:hypothetical protein
VYLQFSCLVVDQVSFEVANRPPYPDSAAGIGQFHAAPQSWA